VNAATAAAEPSARSSTRSSTRWSGRSSTRSPHPATDVPTWVRAFAELYLEVEAGLRPARHLRPLLSVDLLGCVGAVRQPAPAAAAPRIGHVRVQRRGAVCEAVVLLHGDRRTSALVVAMRRQREGWRVTAVGRPEGPSPRQPANPAAAPVPVELSADDADEPVEDGAGWHLPGAALGPTWALPAGWAAASRAA
jgi:hypothetical protein